MSPLPGVIEFRENGVPCEEVGVAERGASDEDDKGSDESEPDGAGGVS